MHTLRQEHFDLKTFMRRRGWNTVISITLLAALVAMIVLKTEGWKN
jgi:hypothetical protein